MELAATKEGPVLLGQLILKPHGRGEPKAARLYGLPVLRSEVDRSGFWGERRLRRAGQALRREGVRRVLAPEALLPLLEALGLRRVDPESFVRAQSATLALAALERQGLAPDRSVVALRGRRTDRDFLRTAEELCPQVRSLIIDAPQGGKELARWLRQEYGIPILPEGERGQVALVFQAGCPRWEEVSLELFGSQPRLAGLTLTVPELEEGDREDLSLLTALWEGGRLRPEDIKIT